MKNIIVQLTEFAKQDYDTLPDNLKGECLELLHKLKKRGKNFGIALDNRNGKDLRGYYKLYFNQAKHRIVYTLAQEKVEIAEIGKNKLEVLDVVGIGKRDKEFIYDLVKMRSEMDKEGLYKNKLPIINLLISRLNPCHYPYKSLPITALISAITASISFIDAISEGVGI